ncbi:hypothetical protein BJ741DRAFT_599198 [Chytriomyces cf. hyalinus JEL632]|nr:hypothetical protein BJ741DRAFT_599198 [Chytriomyces cf. hyalinus JEL632]
MPRRTCTLSFPGSPTLAAFEAVTAFLSQYPALHAAFMVQASDRTVITPSPLDSHFTILNTSNYDGNNTRHSPVDQRAIISSKHLSDTNNHNDSEEMNHSSRKSTQNHTIRTSSTTTATIPLNSLAPKSAILLPKQPVFSKSEDGFIVSTLPCENCETTVASRWRKDEHGKRVCNACGVYERMYGRKRSIRPSSDGVKRRSRGLSLNY